MLYEDTIVALSTGNGISAISLIRLSGVQSFPIINQIFKKKKVFNAKKQKTHTAHFGVIRENDVFIDEVVVTIYKNPNSYTGEDLVEIGCHGSNFIRQEIINLCLKKGARLANSGEFTQRAFFNGKLDLSQAEAVADLISSENATQHEIAVNQMRGNFSSKLQTLREELVNLAALVELELDFSEEDVEFVERKEFLDLIDRLKKEIYALIQSFNYGNAIKEGVPVAIVGKPNAGKSSLLNALLNEEKAIVSHIAGTTRDVIEDTLVLNGVKFRFIDTAGLRNTTDVIEAQGVKRAREKAAKAKIVLYVFDRSDITPDEMIKDLKSIYKKGLILILLENKIDKLDSKEKDFRTIIEQGLSSNITFEYLSISTLWEQTIDAVKTKLIQEIEQLKVDSDTIVTNIRHKAALEQTLASLKIIESGLRANLSGDLLSFEIRNALQNLGEITGQVDVDKDILGTIFSKFCIGK